MRKTLIWCLILFAGCAPRVPLFDMAQIRNPAKFNSDVIDCQRIAEGRMGADESALAGTALGGAFGAGTGAGLGALSDDAGTGALAGLLVGSLTGLLSGAVAGHQAQAVVVRNCMAGRGYRPLD